MKSETVVMKASELVEDFGIYPRNSVYDGHVSDLAEQIRGGAVLPHIVADKTSKVITDGFHRRRGWVRVGGPDAQVPVILIDFPDRAAMLCDSIARNAVHGRRLTKADIARCAQLAKQLRVSRETLSGLLHLTRDSLKEITVSRMATGASGAIVLRQPMTHLAGTRLSAKQEEVAAHVGGQPAIQHVNILIRLIESESLPMDNERLLDRLKILQGLLEGMLVT